MFISALFGIMFGIISHFDRRWMPPTMLSFGIVAVALDYGENGLLAFMTAYLFAFTLLPPIERWMYKRLDPV